MEARASLTKVNRAVSLICTTWACKSLILHDAGVDEPDSGAVRKRNTSIGYLPQSPELDEGLSAIDAILNSGSILARCSLAYEQAIASGDQKVSHNPAESIS